ncbi:hypothetical protein [Amycolatopsis sp. cmx-4-83]|uniref:hypothetical protein n=1 Tax=Amycolatopsis sp. cmx-4-83 TaxID=2790940 RepID=UPI00397BDA0A
MTIPLGAETRDLLGSGLPGLSTPVGALACLLSTVPLVPFVLLRRMRRAALPDGTLGVEAALCASDVVESISADGFVMEPEIVALLRNRLRDAIVREELLDPAHLQPVIRLGTTTLAPVLHLEAGICWSYVTSTEFLTDADTALRSVVTTIATEHRTRLLTWASAALLRLPEATLRGSGAWALAQMCAAAGLPHPRLALPRDFDIELLALASWLFPEQTVGLWRDGKNLELGTPSARRRLAIKVPATSPTFLWAAVGDGDPRLVRLDEPGAPAVLPTGRSRVTLRAVDGRVVELPPFTTDKSPEARSLDESLDRLEGARRTGEYLEADIIRPVPTVGGLVVRFIDEIEIDAFLPSSLSSFHHAPAGTLGQVLTGRITVAVQSLDRRTQRVIVRRVRKPWSVGTLRVGSQVKAAVIAKFPGGMFVSLNEGARVSRSEHEPLVGLLRPNRLQENAAWQRRSKGVERSARSYPLAIGDVIDVVVESIKPSARWITVRAVPPNRAPGGSWPPPLSVGSTVRAVVVRKDYFGLSVAVLPDGAEPGGEPSGSWNGIVINTELSWLSRWTRHSNAEEFPVEIGETVDAVVIVVDNDNHRLGLSLKRTTPDPVPAYFAQLRVGQRVKGVLLGHGPLAKGWRVNVGPWCVIGHAPRRLLDDQGATPKRAVRGTIRALMPESQSVSLTDVELLDEEGRSAATDGT